jgi:hypothetical protein
LDDRININREAERRRSARWLLLLGPSVAGCLAVAAGATTHLDE